MYQMIRGAKKKKDLLTICKLSIFLDTAFSDSWFGIVLWYKC